ncbi:MAG: FKBP-type peptidyl-prolyl cis-trans isomerase [Pirellulaceae bacterium]|jgi:FKBP-type peptidyl-prolyl cis-trans isomerase|nr:FKBP-type peptidyl-prolyl cis-trans isomerase [Pirellulaceae bacterium]
MTRIGLCLTLIALSAAAALAQPPAAPQQPPKTLKDQASYGIGFNIGQNLKGDELDVDPAMLARGLVDALTGAKPLLTDQEMAKALEEFQKVVEQQVAQRAGKAAQEGEAFLTDNAKKEGIVVLPSGLQYKVLKQGSGPSPTATDVVRTHYHGTFINGKVFDSSVERGEPAEFPVNRVIPGWTEALQLMKVGDKWQLFIPAKLAYGKRGSPGGIAPDTTLVFEVELLDIVK